MDYPGCLALLLNGGQDAVKNAASNGQNAALTAVINRQDSLGNTPLHYAVQFWSQDTVTQLLLLGIPTLLSLGLFQCTSTSSVFSNVQDPHGSKLYSRRTPGSGSA